MQLSCGLPPGPDLPDLAALAEDLGYARLWVFDSAPLWEDTFVHLALAAQRTSRIGLSTAVLVPTQRSVMSMASAIATIARLAPGRVRMAFGTGYTSRHAIGKRPMPLKDLMRYVQQVRALLAGEAVEIDGAVSRMLHWDSLALPRPIEVPLWVSVFGPRGRAMVADVADGIVGGPHPDLPSATMVSGTVLNEDEEPTADRVLQAIAPWRLTAWHMAYADGGPEVVDALPAGAEWRAALEAEQPAERRHLLPFEAHVTHVTPRDRRLLPDIDVDRMVGSLPALSAEVAAMAADGLSEIIYTPAGPDVARELRSFRPVAP